MSLTTYLMHHIINHTQQLVTDINKMVNTFGDISLEMFKVKLLTKYTTNGVITHVTEKEAKNIAKTNDMLKEHIENVISLCKFHNEIFEYAKRCEKRLSYVVANIGIILNENLVNPSVINGYQDFMTYLANIYAELRNEMKGDIKNLKHETQQQIYKYINIFFVLLMCTKTSAIINALILHDNGVDTNPVNGTKLDLIGYNIRLVDAENKISLDELYTEIMSDPQMTRIATAEYITSKMLDFFAHEFEVDYLDANNIIQLCLFDNRIFNYAKQCCSLIYKFKHSMTQEYHTREPEIFNFIINVIYCALMGEEYKRIDKKAYKEYEENIKDNKQRIAKAKEEIFKIDALGEKALENIYIYMRTFFVLLLLNMIKTYIDKIPEEEKERKVSIEKFINESFKKEYIKMDKLYKEIEQYPNLRLTKANIDIKITSIPDVPEDSIYDNKLRDEIIKRIHSIRAYEVSKPKQIDILILNYVKVNPPGVSEKINVSDELLRLITPGDSRVPILIIIHNSETINDEKMNKEINVWGSQQLTNVAKNKTIRTHKEYLSIIMSTKIDISQELDDIKMDNSENAQTRALRDGIVSIMNRS